MGCHVQILLETEQTVAALVLQQTSAWFAAWEAQLSRFQTHSELNQLNRTGKGYVSETLWQVLQAALLLPNTAKVSFNPPYSTP